MRTVALGDVVEIVSGATPKTGVADYWDGDVHWATPADLSQLDSAYIDATPRRLTQAGVRSCATTVLPAGSVLLSSRAPIGHVAINTVPMATNQGFKSLVPGPSVDAKYLYYWLKSNRDYLQSLGNGATFKELSKKTTEQIQVPLPPVPEQRRIAAILDQADVLRAKRRQVLAHLDTLTQSIFHEMFGHSRAQPVPIGSFADVRTGGTPSRVDPGNYGGTIPWVKTGEVKGGTITATSEHVTERGVASARLRLFPVGAVVVAMYGQGRTRGQTSLLGIPATTNQACAVICPSQGFVPAFLHAQLTLSYERLRGEAEGGNQPNLSIGRIASFEVMLPPLGEQHAFAARVEFVNDQRDRVRRARAEEDGLFASLQARAFRGEL